LTIQRSGTRKEELLIPERDLQRIWVLRKVAEPAVSGRSDGVADRQLSKTRANSEFLFEY